MDRWKDDYESNSDYDDQPDNPQSWHKPEPRPKKPGSNYVWINGQWRQPDWDDNPQRWHKD
jgi:hypothetical protein